MVKGQGLDYPTTLYYTLSVLTIKGHKGSIQGPLGVLVSPKPLNPKALKGALKGA